MVDAAPLLLLLLLLLGCRFVLQIHTWPQQNAADMRVCRCPAWLWDRHNPQESLQLRNIGRSCNQTALLDI
jgi:hypothetical protein